MVIKDKVAAAVYIDAVAADAARFDQSAVELLVFSTGLLIDTLAIRKKVPSPTLSAPARTLPLSRAEAEPSPTTGSETVAIRGFAIEAKADSTDPGVRVGIAEPSAAPEHIEAELEEPPAAPEHIEAEPEERPAAPAPAPAAPEPEAPPPPSRSFELQTEPPGERSWPKAPQDDEPEGDSNFATAMFPMLNRPQPAAEPKPPAVGPTPVADLADRPTTQYIPPPGLARGGLFTGKPDEERKHEEARRFARLLVSEIKLYNESQVEQGRRDRDLYERLKEDIDRSRQMYDERVPDEVRKGTNYFFDELVRILADGNRDALGL
jgi:hypothetical protein